jgi:hypothetical protein
VCCVVLYQHFLHIFILPNIGAAGFALLPNILPGSTGAAGFAILPSNVPTFTLFDK